MGFTERLTEQLAVVGAIDPSTGVVALISSDVINMQYHRRCLFTLMTGDTVGGTGILVQIQEGTVAVPNSAVILTSIATAVATVDNQYIWEVSAEAMDVGYNVLRADVTPTGASILAMLIQADVERYHPASDLNHADATIMGTAN